MASVDKTYINWEEYKRVRAFFTSEVLKKIKSDIGVSFSYNRWRKSDFKKEGKPLPIWNTETLVDLWLARNCKLDFIQARLRQQYTKDWIGWRKLKFEEKGFFTKIANKRSWISPYRIIGENKIQTFDTLLVYGTTFVDKFLYSAEAMVRGEDSSIEFGNDSFVFTVEFEIFGRHLRARRSLGETEIIDFEDGRQVYLGYFPEVSFGKGSFDNVFERIKVKRSFRKADFLKFETEQIVMSHEDECFNVEAYKLFNREDWKRYFYFFPKWILRNLK